MKWPIRPMGCGAEWGAGMGTSAVDELTSSLKSLDQANHLHPFTSVAAHAADGPLVMSHGRERGSPTRR